MSLFSRLMNDNKVSIINLNKFTCNTMFLGTFVIWYLVSQITISYLFERKHFRLGNIIIPLIVRYRIDNNREAIKDKSRISNRIFVDLIYFLNQDNAISAHFVKCPDKRNYPDRLSFRFLLKIVQ